MQIDQDTLITALVSVVGYESGLTLIRWLRGLGARPSVRLASGAVKTVATPKNISKVISIAGGKALLYTKYGWAAKGLLWALERTGKIESTPDLERFGKPVADRVKKIATEVERQSATLEITPTQIIQQPYNQPVEVEDDGNPITQDLT